MQQTHGFGICGRCDTMISCAQAGQCTRLKNLQQIAAEGVARRQKVVDRRDEWSRLAASMQQMVKAADPRKSAMERQEGGSHYKTLAIQPMQYSMANGLDACQHTIVKYVTRFRSKGGIADLRKAIHTLEMLIEIEEAKQKQGPSLPPVELRYGVCPEL